jgi:hypothetical protein
LLSEIAYSIHLSANQKQINNKRCGHVLKKIHRKPSLWHLGASCFKATIRLVHPLK